MALPTIKLINKVTTYHSPVTHRVTEINKRRNSDSVTKTKEYGYFIRTKFRHGTKKRQKTVNLPKNPNKVILGKVGDLEVYVLPYDFPDKVFMGLFPMSTYIEEYQINQLFRIYNIIKWYFDQEWQTKPKRRKGANYRRRAIQRSYEKGLESQTEPGKRSSQSN